MSEPSGFTEQEEKNLRKKLTAGLGSTVIQRFEALQTAVTDARAAAAAANAAAAAAPTLLLLMLLLLLPMLQLQLLLLFRLLAITLNQPSPLNPIGIRRLMGT